MLFEHNLDDRRLHPGYTKGLGSVRAKRQLVQTGPESSHVDEDRDRIAPEPIDGLP